MKTKATTNSPFTARRTAETTIWLFGILIVLALLMSLNASANTPPNPEEAYIDDIPFDTEMVVNHLLMAEYDFEEEAYIDDLPFDTKKITEEMTSSVIIEKEYTLEDEAYIYDIPFSTELVVSDYKYDLVINKVFELPEETEVDDIPFNTGHIASAVKDGNYSMVIACTK